MTTFPMNAASLETPSRWRVAGAIGIVILVTLPTFVMLVSSLHTGSGEILRASFINALQNAMVVAAAVALLAASIGMPLGVLASRYVFPLRNVALAVVALPLLLPTFLWAIGWSSILDLTGYSGAILSFAAPSISLVALTTLVSAHSLSASQAEAALLAGGESTVLKHTLGYVAVPACAAALLAGLLSLSDPGPGQIFGLATVSGEILTSFSAFYDFNLASRQCLALAGVVLIAAIPFGFGMAPHVSSEILAKQTRAARLVRSRRGEACALTAVLLYSVTVLSIPLLGLIQPVVADGSLGRAWSELIRTVESTGAYTIGSGVIATLFGLSFAAAVGRSDRMKSIAVAVCFVLFAVPPAVTALAFVHAGTSAPQWADVIFRSRFAVMLASGARFFPVAALVAMRAWTSMPRNWALAGGVHGVPLTTYLRFVVLPYLTPSLLASVIICGLLATADVVTVLLVHPPGQSSLPLTIFTIMANAPQSLVAMLCLLYVGSAVVLLSVLLAIAKGMSK
jgi:iron(III) transport system permease protein